MTNFQTIINWASAFTAEERSEEEFYYVTEPVKRLEWSLLNVSNQLIALTGLQGTGKTSALNYLSRTLTKKGVKNVKVKWTENWRETLFKSDEKLAGKLEQNIEAEIYELLCAYAYAGKVFPILGRKPTLDHMNIQVARELYEKSGLHSELILGKGKTKQIEDATLKEFLTDCSVIFIDLPDYTKTNRRFMDKHLSEVQALWESVVRTGKNIVVSIQKELFSGHFFFGKMDVKELKPLKAEEFLQVFKMQFSDYNNVMTDDAIILLGQLSKGVFRRFLKYLKETIEKYNQNLPIDVKQVNDAVTIEDIMADMELELYDAFKDANQRRQAVELLHKLRSGAISQKGIADFLNVSEATAGKIVSKLLVYHYVNRERGEGKEWLISLKV